MLSAATAVAFFGTVVVAPLSMPSAAAEEDSFEAFNERIHQQFVPEAADVPVIDLSISTPERLPDPEPEPEPVVAAPVVLLYTGGGSPAEWMAQAGIAESDWGFVDYIVSRESGWNPNATNPSSGACGLVQAYPCSKVPGSGYNPIDNLRWSNGYAVGRYGSWEQAYAFWSSNHWW